MEVEIECLPNDIPDFIEVNLATLEEIDDAIHFRDLSVPGKVKILNEPDDIVAKISEIRVVVEEESTKAEATTESAEGTGEAASGTAASSSTADKASAPATKDKTSNSSAKDK